MSTSVDPTPPSPEKKIESRMTAPKSAIVPGGDDQLTEGRGDLSRVLEDGHQYPERSRAKNDRHQQWRLDQAAGLESHRDDDRDNEREGEPGQRQMKDLAAQLPEVDLQAGQEEKECQADDRYHRDRFIDVDDRQHRRPDDDPGDDLQDHGRQAHLRKQTEDERSGKGNGHHDQESAEGGHAATSLPGGEALRRRADPSPIAA